MKFEKFAPYGRIWILGTLQGLFRMTESFVAFDLDRVYPISINIRLQFSLNLTSLHGTSNRCVSGSHLHATQTMEPCQLNNTAVKCLQIISLPSQKDPIPTARFDISRR